jgi:acetoin utilization protein AcuC
MDVDGHHGDGTQALLYQEPVLKVSIHQYDGRFFPKTGALGERGAGPGWGYSVNLPLPRFATDAEYLPLLHIGLEQVEAYRPQAIILQYGVDAHYTDRMVGLKISTLVYEQVAQQVHDLAHRVCGGRLLVVGGGGYEPATVARCWSILMANLAGRRDELGRRYRELHDSPANLPAPVVGAVEEVNRLLQVVKQML